ncbi:MAG: WD40 repeat domain-containing protein [bacterium]
MNSTSRWIATAAFTFIALLASPPATHAVTTQQFKDDTFSDLKEGELESTSLSSDGKIFIAPEKSKLCEVPDAKLIWSLARASDGKVFLGTGNTGQIFLYDGISTAPLFGKLDEKEVYALALDSQGRLYASGSPGGKIYRFSEAQKSELFYDTKENYVWDLLFLPDGSLLAATGTKGKLFKIAPDGQGSVLFECKSKNLMCLALEPDGHILLGSQGKAFLYRLTQDGKASVLYQPTVDEIRRVAPGPHGVVYALLNSDRLAESDLFRVQPPTSAPSEESGESQGDDNSPENPAEAIAALMKEAAEARSSMGGKPSGGASQVVKITSEGFVQTLWPAVESPLHALVVDNVTSSLLVAAGSKGKIFRVEDNGDYSIVESVDEDQVLALAAEKGGSYLLATGKAPCLYRLSAARSQKGIFRSRVFDAQSPVLWGKLWWKGERQNGSRFLFSSRSGNVAEPDKTWGDWSADLEATDESLPISSPVGRFLQYRLTLQQPASAPSPIFDLAELYYVAPNIFPRVKEIKITKPGQPSGPPPSKPSDKESGGGISDELKALLSKGESEGPDSDNQTGPGSAVARGRQVSTREDSNAKRVSIRWTIDDPNHDDHLSHLYFKAEGETTWKEIEKDLTSPRFTFSTDSIPDGEYRVKVVVTDSPSNPRELAGEASLVSDRFTVDQTTPQFSNLKSSGPDNKKFKVGFTASDASSLLASAKYNVNAGDWNILFPTDGIFDSKTETFEFETPSLDGAEHTLSISVTDAEGNTRIERLFLKP